MRTGNKSMNFASVAIAMVTFTCSAAAQDISLALVSNVDPPYQYLEGDSLVGSSYDSLQCVGKAVGFGVSVELRPWNRARQQLADNTSQGLFTVAQDEELQKIAVLSAPLALEKWTWYTRDPNFNEMPTPDLTKDRKIGAILGSNAMNWLSANGYLVDATISNMPQLIKMLESGRVDLILADADAVSIAAKTNAIDEKIFHRKFLRYMPLGVYFSTKFISANPNFLKRFNENLAPCNTVKETLQQWEIEELTKHFNTTIAPKLNESVLIDALISGNNVTKDYDTTRIDQLDNTWKLEAKSEKLPPDGVIASVEKNEASSRLRNILAESNGLISEIVVFDQKGLNVAQAKPTSDFWQGDEPKYVQTVGSKTLELHFDEIKFDESSGKFQTQISRSITNLQGEIIGGITVGFDIQTALTR